MPTDKSVANPLPQIKILSDYEAKVLRTLAGEKTDCIPGAAFNQACEGLFSMGFISSHRNLTDAGRRWLEQINGR